MNLQDEIKQKVVKKLDSNEIEAGTENKDLSEVINKEYEKQVKHLEKTFQNDPEYKQIQQLIVDHPEQKLYYLQTIASKYTKELTLDSPDYLSVNERSNIVNKHHSIDASQGWSEAKSNNFKLTGFPNSVRNSRYAKDDISKSGHSSNLRIIKKLHLEKKKREKVMQYVEEKQLHKAEVEAAKQIEMEERKQEEHEEKIKEWKEK
jgi:hypothetical protein